MFSRSATVTTPPSTSPVTSTASPSPTVASSASSRAGSPSGKRPLFPGGKLVGGCLSVQSEEPEPEGGGWAGAAGGLSRWVVPGWLPDARSWKPQAPARHREPLQTDEDRPRNRPRSTQERGAHRSPLRPLLRCNPGQRPPRAGPASGHSPGGDRRASLVSRRTQDPPTHGGAGATALQPCPTPPPLQGRKGGGSLHPHPPGPPDPGPHPPRRPPLRLSLRATGPPIIHKKSDIRSAECGSGQAEHRHSSHRWWWSGEVIEQHDVERLVLSRRDHCGSAMGEGYRLGVIRNSTRTGTSSSPSSHPSNRLSALASPWNSGGS